MFINFLLTEASALLTHGTHGTHGTRGTHGTHGTNTKPKSISWLAHTPTSNCENS